MSHRSLNSIGGDGINTNLRASQVPICCESTKERRRFRKSSRKLVQLLSWTFTRSEKIFLQLGCSESCKPTISSFVSHAFDLELYALFSNGRNKNAPTLLLKFHYRISYHISSREVHNVIRVYNSNLSIIILCPKKCYTNVCGRSF